MWEREGGDTDDPPATEHHPGLRTVRALGLVSLLTDASSEAVYPVLPLFLANVLGTPVAVIGVIESVAEASASLTRVFSGRISDRLGRRRPLVLLGYGISNAVKPLLALAASWPVVLALRFADRVGKGIRTAPRDALIADAVPPAVRGHAFGLHRALDTLGAAIGPAIAWLVLTLVPQGYRAVFLVSAVPGTLAIGLLLLAVREPGGVPHRARPRADTLQLRHLGPGFGAFAALSALFALGNSSDALLVLRAQDLGMRAPLVPLAYFAFNVVGAALATRVGVASDRIGRRPVLVGGWLLYATVYAGFAAARGAWAPWALFIAYGIPYAMTEGMARAFVVDLVAEEMRATAVGGYTFVLGLSALAASAVAGVLWDRVSHAAPFAVSAVLMALAAAGLALFGKRLRASGRA